MHTLLLVEDDPGIQSFNQELLEERGYAVRAAMTLAQARQALRDASIDLIVLDVTLPDGSGIDFLQELRQAYSMPVLVLTAKAALPDKLQGFASGADDYLPKPYDYEELLARIGALLQRAQRLPEQVVFGALSLDVNAARAYLHGKDLLLRQKEFALLLLLAQNHGKPMSGEEVYRKIWGQSIEGDTNALQTVVSRLRKKIAPIGMDVQYTRGIGYMLK